MELKKYYRKAYAELPAPTRATIQFWNAAQHRFSLEGRWASVQPLWGNPNLSHFQTIPDPQVWARFGIKTLRDIMPTGSLMSFAQMARTYELPGWMFFRYAQLRHAVRAQFPVPPLLQLDPVKDLHIVPYYPRTLPKWIDYGRCGSWIPLL